MLHPSLQLLLLAPVFLCIDPMTRPRIVSGWNGLRYSLSRLPSRFAASYHFTVILLPITIFCGYLLRRKQHLCSAQFCCSISRSLSGMEHEFHRRMGGAASRAATLCADPPLRSRGLSDQEPGGLLRTRQQRWWGAAIAALLVFNVTSGLRHQRGLFDDYKYRLAEPEDDLIAAQPVLSHGAIHYIALMFDGYRARKLEGTARYTDDLAANSSEDQLSIAASDDAIWTETTTPASELRSSIAPALVNAESPAISFDGKSIAYLREVRGRKQLFSARTRPAGSPAYSLLRIHERRRSHVSAQWVAHRIGE